MNFWPVHACTDAIVCADCMNRHSCSVFLSQEKWLCKQDCLHQLRSVSTAFASFATRDPFFHLDVRVRAGNNILKFRRMSGADSTTPDLASVLQALASYGTQEQQASQSHPPNYVNKSDNYNAANDPRLNGSYRQPHPQHRSHGSQPYEPSSPAIDACSITEWPLGLRCVTQMSMQNSDFKPAVRKVCILFIVCTNPEEQANITQMIHDQRLHEESWSRGLEELLEKQSRQPLAKASPAELAIINEDPNVKTYVAKVYSAAAEMHKVMSQELKNLGVPFFGTSNELIDRTGFSSDFKDGRLSSKISEKQLLVLQRKMIQHLEDMYG